ncbi:MAG TPA: hypothetical protein VFQ53_11835 [Kofleriaceae bacterium]|nr:hypothetical protein [Kofleriaceae bacterium]
MRGFAILGIVALVTACSSSAPTIGDDDGPGDDAQIPADAPQPIDRDQDGLDDARELALATAYLPYVSLDPGDGCSLDGYVVRVRPHPQDATKILIVYDHLFETDCGFGGHTGDNEVFAVAIDPARPAPDGILAIKTASHQGTFCERVSECSTCGDGRDACDRAPLDGAMWPVLYASKDKHGQYATKRACPLIGTCLDACTLNPTPKRAPIVNAGEPGHPLVTNLTTDGFINAANGWTKPELMNVDPWATGDFGGAGNIADDLVDPVFAPATCSS